MTGIGTIFNGGFGAMRNIWISVMRLDRWIRFGIRCDTDARE